jgi:hypothetical protein
MRLTGERRPRVLVIVIVFSLTISCTTKEQKEENLARQYCGTCHSFPEPSLLDKSAWATVMPQMAVRMGLDISPLLRLNEADYPYVMQTLPKSPMISPEDFDAISRYYDREAPDSLIRPAQLVTKEMNQFTATPLKVLKQRPTITMLRVDTVKKNIWLSNRHRMLYKYDYNFKPIDSLPLTSVASSAIFSKPEPMFSLMGFMDPNDQPAGSVIALKDDGTLQTIVDSLKRPVFIEQADLNNDKLNDIVVCAFGNYGGDLAVYENAGNGQYIKHTLSSLPGARKVVLKDFNKDGLIDVLALLTQGDEQISLFSNSGSFRFRITTLLRFPPVYGSEFFDVVDFNKDGNWDIVYANGDNADYSIIKKPYHGVRVFLNDGDNQFKESWFQPLDGCAMAIAKDYDKDGDVDVATISFFPDFKKSPQFGFVYFENNQGKMEPYITPLAPDGRWLLMETADIDEDGYTDILLGALDFETGVPEDIDKLWHENHVDVLVLKNLSRGIRDRGKK